MTRIRDAEIREREALGRLHRSSSMVWPEDRAALDAHPDALGVAAAAITEGRVRVALGPRGQLRGFSVVLQDGDGGCELEDLFVDPATFRRGIGRALVEDAAERARSAGCTELGVVAHPRNFPFYESLGFHQVGPASTRFGPAVRMLRGLAEAGPLA
jgi:ribosomal protein S18 acetylase RimI-like enzyme